MTTEPTNNEPYNSVASLLFLVFLVGGSLCIAFWVGIAGPLAWCIGMIVGFLFGVFAVVEFQIDKESRRERTN